jgi:hypothetical protein
MKAQTRHEGSRSRRGGGVSASWFETGGSRRRVSCGMMLVMTRLERLAWLTLLGAFVVGCGSGSNTSADGAAGKSGAAGSAAGTAGGSAGHAGSGGGGSAGTGGSSGSGGAGAAGSGGATCGSKTCAPGGKCCYACVSLCADPGAECPVFIQDPCSQQTRDGGAATACGNQTCGLGQTCVHPCCGGAPPLPGVPPCTPPPPFCVETRSCSNQAQGNSVCCFGDAGAGCCGGIQQGGLSCLCA